MVRGELHLTRVDIRVLSVPARTVVSGERRTVTDVDLDDLLDDAEGDVKDAIASMPMIVEKGNALDVGALPIDARKWHRVDEVVAVVSDLRHSTRIVLNRKSASAASIYEASTGGVVQILDKFDVDFTAIQGDGVIGLFWGDKRMERAVCAGITIKTFSFRHLVPRLGAKWSDLQTTGLKVGVAASPILVKRVGIPRTNHQEPVWAGRAVNYAAKAAQQAEIDQMVVTGSVWDWAEDNEYLAVSCSCRDPSPEIWQDITIDKVPEEDGEREGKVLTSLWCQVHGGEYCSAVLAGETARGEEAAHAEVAKVLTYEAQSPLRLKAALERKARRAHLRGMRLR